MMTPSAATLWQRWKPWWLSAAAGALLGCLYRLIFGFNWWQQHATVMTLGFLLVVPFCMGYVAVEQYLRTSARKEIRWADWFFLPWLSVLITMAVSVAVKWEGLICLIFAAPIMMVSSVAGGAFARLSSRRFRDRTSSRVSAFALPLLVILVESQFPSPWTIRTVETDSLIRAPAALVWQNVKSVNAISPSELPGSWVTWIGFPKPVAATLSHPGVGGIRNASFTGGVLFTETVVRWKPDSDLQFSIRANTRSIPAATLDEHVTIGGAFFDVLDGEYRLEPRPDGTWLRLISRERVSTHFNPYAGAWTDAVMRSIQTEILEVIRKRCERQSETPAESVGH